MQIIISHHAINTKYYPRKHPNKQKSHGDLHQHDNRQHICILETVFVPNETRFKNKDVDNKKHFKTKYLKNQNKQLKNNVFDKNHKIFSCLPKQCKQFKVEKKTIFFFFLCHCFYVYRYIYTSIYMYLTKLNNLFLVIPLYLH
jgi:hypothetical protein